MIKAEIRRVLWALVEDATVVETCFKRDPNKSKRENHFALCKELTGVVDVAERRIKSIFN